MAHCEARSDIDTETLPDSDALAHSDEETLGDAVAHGLSNVLAVRERLPVAHGDAPDETETQELALNEGVAKADGDAHELGDACAVVASGDALAVAHADSDPDGDAHELGDAYAVVASGDALAVAHVDAASETVKLAQPLLDTLCDAAKDADAHALAVTHSEGLTDADLDRLGSDEGLSVADAQGDSDPDGEA